MTPDDLLERLKAELTELFEDMILYNALGEATSPGVYKGSLPDPTGDDDSEVSCVPYCIARISSIDQDDFDAERLADVVLIFCTHDGANDNQGYTDILNLYSRVYERFGKNPYVEDFRAVKPPSWVGQDTDTSPFYFGACQMQFVMPAVRGEDDLS